MLSLISIHIPKTAGTNFTKILQHIYGPSKIYLDYGSEHDLVTARTCPAEIAADTETFRQTYAAIHGHFHYLKYKDTFPDVAFLATLRHPIARIVSQYRHVALHGNPAVLSHQKVMSGEMGLVRFSQLLYIGNAQAAFLEGIDVEKLDHVILQEHFPESVTRFCTKIGFDPEDPTVRALVEKKINSRDKAEWNTKAQPIDPALFGELEQYCQRDLVLYAKALDRFMKAA